MMPTPSLAQRRIAINRIRFTGIWMVSASVVLIICDAIFMSDDGGRPLELFIFALGGVTVVNGVRQLIKFRRERAAFESENGPDAGKQTPVT